MSVSDYTIGTMNALVTPTRGEWRVASESRVKGEWRVKAQYKDFLIRDWSARDRTATAEVIASILAEYGLSWEPLGADRDVLEVENFYLSTGGEFWVIEKQSQLVGTGGYFRVSRGEKAVEIRKMYILPSVRGLGLGKFLLQQLEIAIAAQGFEQIWIETASALFEAVKLYETSGYLPATGVETTRCDRVYCKIIALPNSTNLFEF